MKTNAKMMAIGLLVAAVALYSGAALAGTASRIGAGDANTNLNFSVTIPKFVYFNIDVDNIVLNPTISNDGTLTSPSQTVNVTYFSNVPNTTITSVESAPLRHTVSGVDIPWSYITITSSDTTNFNPGVVDGANFTPGPTGTYIASYDVDWTYQFDPPNNDLEGGTYTGVITYTVTVP